MFSREDSRNVVDNYHNLVRLVAVGIWLTRWRRVDTYHTGHRRDRIDL